jgi:hypothetical protein
VFSVSLCDIYFMDGGGGYGVDNLKKETIIIANL